MGSIGPHKENEKYFKIIYFCFMGFFWVESNNYVLKIVILVGNFLLIVIL